MAAPFTISHPRQKTAALKRPVKGSNLTKRWGAEETRRRIAELQAHLGEGKDDLQIAEEMSLKTAEYNELKREMYTWETTDLNAKPMEEVYINYVLHQKQCIKDLDGMIREFRRTNQYNAMVGAVRAKSDILDKIIAKGQEFSILEKAPEKKQVIAGLMVANLDNEQLRAFITRELVGIDSLTKRYGDVDILGAPAPLATLPPATSALPASGNTVVPGRPSRAAGGLSKAAGPQAGTVARVKAKQTPPEPGA
jgi:hypothetical protein